MLLIHKIERDLAGNILFQWNLIFTWFCSLKIQYLFLFLCGIISIVGAIRVERISGFCSGKSKRQCLYHLFEYTFLLVLEIFKCLCEFLFYFKNVCHSYPMVIIWFKDVRHVTDTLSCSLTYFPARIFQYLQEAMRKTLLVIAKILSNCFILPLYKA